MSLPDNQKYVTVIRGAQLCRQAKSHFLEELENEKVVASGYYSKQLCWQAP
jgi:hypothetical protein